MVQLKRNNEKKQQTNSGLGHCHSLLILPILFILLLLIHVEKNGQKMITGKLTQEKKKKKFIQEHPMEKLCK